MNLYIYHEEQDWSIDTEFISRTPKVKVAILYIQPMVTGINVMVMPWRYDNGMHVTIATQTFQTEEPYLVSLHTG